MQILFQWVLLSYVSLFAFGMADNLRGPVFPEILTRFGLTHTIGALFFLVVSAVSILGAKSASPLIRKLGHIKVLQIFLLVQGLSQLVFAFAPEFYILLLGSVFFGLAAGGLGVVQNVMILKAVSPEKHQRFQGGLHACYGASSLLSPLVVIVLHRMNIDWQLSFLAPAILSLVLFAFSFFANSEILNKESELQKSEPFLALQNRESFFIGAILAIYVALEILISSRLPIYLREQSGLTLETSSFMSTLLFVGLLAGRILTALWPPRASLGRQLQFSLIVCSFLFVISLSVWPMALVGAGFFLAPFYPVMMTAMARLFKNHVQETAGRAIAMTGYTVVVMHFVCGWISDHLGLRMIMAFGLVLTLLTLLMLFSYKRIFGREIA